MANFEPKTFNASDINGGQKFRNGDGISAEAINAPIESALFAQKMVKEFNIPKDGTAGQILTKTENGTAWQDAPSGGGSGGASFSYYSLKPYEDYVAGYKGCIPNLTSIQKIEIDSYIVNAKQFTGSELSSFVESFDSSIGNNSVLYNNEVKNDIDITLDGITQRMYWDIGSKLIIPIKFSASSYSEYEILEIILKIYPKEA